VATPTRSHDPATNGDPRRIGTVAVVAHRKKTLGGGLDELRARLAVARVDGLLWYEVNKSKKAPKRVREAVEAGADLVVVWGGDGMVQRSCDALAGSGVPMAIVPAGTANLLAHNLGIPQDLAAAVDIAFTGRRRTLDLGNINGEHFAVMAGVGFDAELIRDADRGMKDRLGRLAYFWTAAHHVSREATPTTIEVDGTPWFDGEASCVLLGNVGKVTGGVPAFDDALPDDGWLEVGVATATGAAEWARTLGRMVVGRTDASPFVRITRAREISIRLGEKRAYELDGGDRDPADRLTARVLPQAITVYVPDASGTGSPTRE
jgi:diacylglycerol kinase (ATP)